jgi:chromosome transmission fidelity protein 8
MVSLSTPLAILEKKSVSDDQMSGVGTDDEEDREGARVEWQILAVVKKKVVFSKRPMPLLNRPASKIGNK